MAGKTVEGIADVAGGESKIEGGWGEPKSEVAGGESKSGGGKQICAASGRQLLDQAAASHFILIS